MEACINNGKPMQNAPLEFIFPENNIFKLKDISKVLQVQKHSNNVAELTAIHEALKTYDNTDLKYL